MPPPQGTITAIPGSTPSPGAADRSMRWAKVDNTRGGLFAWKEWAADPPYFIHRYWIGSFAVLRSLDPFDRTPDPNGTWATLGAHTFVGYPDTTSNPNYFTFGSNVLLTKLDSDHALVVWNTDYMKSPSWNASHGPSDYPPGGFPQEVYCAIATWDGSEYYFQADLSQLWVSEGDSYDTYDGAHHSAADVAIGLTGNRAFIHWTRLQNGIGTDYVWALLDIAYDDEGGASISIASTVSSAADPSNAALQMSLAGYAPMMPVRKSDTEIVMVGGPQTGPSTAAIVTTVTVDPLVSFAPGPDNDSGHLYPEGFGYNEANGEIILFVGDNRVDYHFENAHHFWRLDSNMDFIVGPWAPFFPLAGWGTSLRIPIAVTDTGIGVYSPVAWESFIDPSTGLYVSVPEFSAFSTDTLTAQYLSQPTQYEALSNAEGPNRYPGYRSETDSEIVYIPTHGNRVMAVWSPYVAPYDFLVAAILDVTFTRLVPPYAPGLRQKQRDDGMSTPGPSLRVGAGQRVKARSRQQSLRQGNRNTYT